MSPDEERQAKELVADVLALPVPDLEPQEWTLFGPRIRLPDRSVIDGPAGDPAASLQDFALDVWRRGEVQRLAEERGYGPEVVELAWLLLPYASTPMRWGWDAVVWVRERRERAERLITDELARANYA